MSLKWIALLTVFVFVDIYGMSAAERKPENIWPSTAPQETGNIGEEKATSSKPGDKQVLRISNVSTPTLQFYPAPKDKNTGTTIVVCPGGGYNILAFDLEGTEVCEWLNTIGVNAVLLKYRVPRRAGLPPYHAPLQDSQRTLSITRTRAKQWGIAEDRIGILGFSAGGNLAAMAALKYSQRNYDEIDAIDKVSCRPDFAVLVYPAYLVKDGKLVPEVQVTKNTPPMFMAHAYNDGVTPESSVLLWLALKRTGVPAEMHITETGGHGYGLRKSSSNSHRWPQRCEQWMLERGLLGKM
jgi:acetyl esterase/lipase